MPKRTILIVENDTAMRDALKDVLQEEGFRIYTASDGYEAMNILREIKAACLILLDLFMPGMSGFDFAAAIAHGSHTFVQIPVVAVTTSSQPLVPPSITQVIKKPFDLDDLMRVVLDHCAT